uniref:(California timema) hypothetical protein n=1 Tax=Timema californicum TaxID=61474 RepID=A0A7R9J6X1_TIMCA|nr:unnamed protein product [Timema californicum]
MGPHERKRANEEAPKTLRRNITRAATQLTADSVRPPLGNQKNTNDIGMAPLQARRSLLGVALHIPSLLQHKRVKQMINLKPWSNTKNALLSLGFSGSQQLRLCMPGFAQPTANYTHQWIGMLYPPHELTRNEETNSDSENEQTDEVTLPNWAGSKERSLPLKACVPWQQVSTRGDGSGLPWSTGGGGCLQMQTSSTAKETTELSRPGPSEQQITLGGHEGIKHSTLSQGALLPLWQYPLSVGTCTSTHSWEFGTETHDTTTGLPPAQSSLLSVIRCKLCEIVCYYALQLQEEWFRVYNCLQYSLSQPRTRLWRDSRYCVMDRTSTRLLLRLYSGCAQYRPCIRAIVTDNTVNKYHRSQINIYALECLCLAQAVMLSYPSAVSCELSVSTKEAMGLL